MTLSEPTHFTSWTSNESPLVLGEIFSASTSVAIWKREINEKISSYFEHTFRAFGLGTRVVLSMDTLKEELDQLLPEYDGKSEAAEDIYLLSDMLTCLFACDAVGLRLVPLTSAMCPSFHVDNIPVRLVNTYVGSGTEWLPVEALHETSASNAAHHAHQPHFGACYDERHIQQMDTFDVGLLKGKAWQKQEKLAAVHRSCSLQKNEKRMLLTLDPM